MVNSGIQAFMVCKVVVIVFWDWMCLDLAMIITLTTATLGYHAKILKHPMYLQTCAIPTPIWTQWKSPTTLESHQ